MRVVNKFPALLLRSPLHGLIIGSVLLITFNGCKSGKKYTTPITCLREGDTVLMTTDSPWWKNLRGARDFADKGPGVRGRRGRHNLRLVGYGSAVLTARIMGWLGRNGAAREASLPISSL